MSTSGWIVINFGDSLTFNVALHQDFSVQYKMPAKPYIQAQLYSVFSAHYQMLAR